MTPIARELPKAGGGSPTDLNIPHDTLPRRSRATRDPLVAKTVQVAILRAPRLESRSVSPFPFSVRDSQQVEPPELGIRKTAGDLATDKHGVLLVAGSEGQIGPNKLTGNDLRPSGK